MKNEVKLFEHQKVRTHWDEKEEKWYFSVSDVIAILTESVDPLAYWRKLKERLKKEGNETVTNLHGLIMLALDGKMRMTDVADTEQLLRLIQSIPSPKAEPFKLWLAKAGYERMQEITDPEQSLYQETRNKLTDYWKKSGVEKTNEFAFLTNIIHKEWAGLSVTQHKNLKELKTQNLRDQLSEAELIFTALAQLSTRQIAETEKAKGVTQNAVAGKKGGKIAKYARFALEQKTGKKVITGENFLPPSKGKKNLE